MGTNTSFKGGKTSRWVLVLVLGLAVLWTGGAILTPWLETHNHLLGGLLRLVYRPGCHQISDRCLDFDFGPMAVCARCTGLYLGGIIGLLWTTIRNRPSRPRLLLLAVVVTPTILDFLAGQVGLPSAGNWTRLAIALPAGLIAGLYLSDALIDIVEHNQPNSDKKSSGPE